MKTHLNKEDASQILQGVRNLCDQGCAREVAPYVIGEVQYSEVSISDPLSLVVSLNACTTFIEFELALKTCTFWPK